MEEVKEFLDLPDQPPSLEDFLKDADIEQEGIEKTQLEESVNKKED